MSARNPLEINPLQSWNPKLESGANPFADAFGKLSNDAWLAILLRSITEPEIDQISFPRLAPDALQMRIQGATSENSYREAHKFYVETMKHGRPDKIAREETFFLDLGSGWGRIIRPFMRDFPLAKIYGYEPNPWFAQVARSLNPYICIINGPHKPDGLLPRSRFHMGTAYSVFSHLSEAAARDWFSELAQVIVQGGRFTFTTWGERFLRRLRREKESGAEVHFYSKIVIDAIGDIDDAIRRFEEGEFVWVRSRPDERYGETFMPLAALARVLASVGNPFAIVHQDSSTLGQDLFVLQRN